jgi:cytidylate kinase
MDKNFMLDLKYTFGYIFNKFDRIEKENFMAVITISRQFGAGGKTIGEMVSKKLGYPLFDNELIQMVAEETKVSSIRIETIEKESSGKFRKFLSGMVPRTLSGMIPRAVADQRGEAEAKDFIREEIYVDLLHEIINKIYEGGNAVIIGRGSQYILKDKQDVFHVLVAADKNDRGKFLVNKYGLSPKNAMQAVNLDDKRRGNLYLKFGKTNYDQPLCYHLVLNTSKIDLETGCEIICELVNVLP